MNTPRDRRRSATVQEIVDAASAIVHDRGLAALSMRTLGERVGLKASSLYQYFASKLDVYDALFAAGHRELQAWMTDLDRSGPAEQVFRRGSAKFTQFCVADPVRYQLLFQRTIPDFVPSPASMAVAQQSYAGVADALARLGIVEARDLDLWVSLQMGLTEQQLANDPGGDRWTTQLDRSIDMFLTFVRPRNRTAKRKP